MNPDHLAELEDASAAFLLGLVGGMKDIRILTTERLIDGKQLSQAERMERIEAIARQALHG